MASDVRRAENEAVFRGANERLEQYAAANVTDDEGRVLPFLCECDRIDCTQVLLATLPEYERVRADSRRSVLVKGHDNPEIERVLEETERFAVTEKFGAAAEAYGDLDPRT